MAKQVRSVDFLPEIFRTPVNEQFLSATLDQLVQNPQFSQTQGYIGRRVGPGVNANDSYVIEPTKTRTDYQLEPGVVQVDPTDTHKIVDAITYPGINDALKLQGAITDNADRLYTSDYYTWDPFVDFDKFVNYAQYYWLPDGPDTVTVTSTSTPTTQTFNVTRANGVYTFSGVPGSNPTITLDRSAVGAPASYFFNITQNVPETVNYRVTNNDASSWNINNLINPPLTLVRGNTYNFDLIQTAAWAFYIKTELSLGTTNVYSNGVFNNGGSDGLVTFTVPYDAPDTLYYCNDIEYNLRGEFTIVDPDPGSGPQFWIQSEPGVTGTQAVSPNISSRLGEPQGVYNNGTDLGTVRFDVPEITAQDFYYNMTSIGEIDLVTDLSFDQINGVTVDEFFTTYPNGIDGITNLRNRTLVFISEDLTPTPTNLYGYWRIQYLDGVDGPYLFLQYVDDISLNNKFVVGFGSQYSTTNWYKNGLGYFTEIPLLTAEKDILYYQDSQDPTIYGQIQFSSALNVLDIIGAPTYTSPNGVVFSNGMKVEFTGDVVPTSYLNNTYYVEGVGTAIQLLPVGNFVVPETYSNGLNAVTDYLTINRASPDLNPWTRSNRWFHIDVIDASAAYNNTVPVLDNNFRAKRPVLEFRAGTRLFDYGTQGITSVNIIDFTETDALSNVAGSIGYSTDGYTLVNGSLIIFAADIDPVVRRTVYSVEFISPDTVPPLVPEPLIVLTPVATALVDQTTIVLNGTTEQGLTYYFDGVEWIEAQQKISVNQPPLFDVYDSNGVSFGNQQVYPSSNFTGSPLFSYAVGDANPDLILGFPLTYLSLTNLGDIVFDNNLYKDSFTYTINNSGQTVPLSSGFVRQYSDRITFQREIGWQTAVTPSLIRQQFQFTYDGNPLQLDVAVNTNNTVPAIQIFANGEFIESTYYTYTVGTNTTTINLLTTQRTYNTGDLIEVTVLSDQISATGFYEVPVNLENNPFNGNSTQFTLGTIRNHYSTIAENLIDLSGPVIGANNTRDLGNIGPYGLQILQQSSPLTLTGYFMRDANYNIFASLAYNSNEYIKFKSQLLSAVTTFTLGEYSTLTVAQILDAAISRITAGRTSLNSFYWSDMLPTGPAFTSNSYTVNAITTNRFNTVQTYDFTTSNYLGLCVYINNVLLTREYDYVVSTEGPTLTITRTLAIGDVVTINEYADTAGNFVPNTPTKLGLYPKFEPKIFLDNDYVNPTPVIQGHDGSITVAFGDIRDDVLLEFEQRIFSNLKNDGNPPPLVADDVIPGYFRTTQYTQDEINQILGENFLAWVGANKVDYTTQNYIPDNEFTYNYSQAANKLDGEPLLGAWRGIYRWFYDTLTPNYTPWEMLGFSEQPTWWTDRYGPTPYTADNLVLWGDLEAGLVADPIAPYVIPKYRRPGLTSVIPVDSQGNLIPPYSSVMGPHNPQGFQKSWTVGDGGPAEASWWMSSSYPFAVMRLLILTRPAEFFSLFADRDLYKYSAEFDQYLYNGRYRIQPQDIQVYGNGVSKASYINWIVDYNQQSAVNSTDALTTDLANLDVRLCYRVASFVAQQNLEMYLEKSAPQSQNDSLLIPPESYNLLLYKNQPFNRINYSSVVIEVVEGGYSVYGYSTTDPYFTIQVSKVAGLTQTLTGGNKSVTVPSQYTTQVAQIPYGYTFTNLTGMVDFLLSYGEYLASQGLTFTVRENGYTLNWIQMAQEFLYFAEQGWAEGTIINLNPSASQLLSFKPGAVVDSIISYTPENLLLDQNRQTFNSQDLIIYRQGNIFQLNPTRNGNQTISYLQLQFTDYEDMIVFDNVTVFNDLIYDPTTAERQSRLKFIAATSTQWNGTLNAQGFILNQNNVKPWKSNSKYTKGDIVIYKNNYWQAANIVQPKAQFDYADWYKSNYDRIEQGLLQNLATKADQLANSYDTQTANLNTDNDLLAFGLIGFNPRQYMVDLNLSDTSQVQLYQQFIKTMGSRNATDLFTQVNFNNLTGQYQLYETWGIQVGTYGAQANRSWFEVALDEAVLNGNPSTFQIIEPDQTSMADQAILLSNLWAESYAIPNTDILPTTYDRNLDTALPTAGYVNFNDVDITVFNLNDPSNIAANLSTVGNGTTIWVAQDNSYDWNIYQCRQVTGRLIQVSDNLNGTSQAQFSQSVNLAVGDLVIIRYFSDAIDGVYRVLSRPAIDTIVIDYAFNNANQTTITGTGIVFYLQTMRVAQASDVINLPYVNQLIPGAKAWVDNDGFGHWEVLEKTDPFLPIEILIDEDAVSNSLFGQSVAQSSDHFAMLVGAPGDNSGAGAVYTYRTNSENQYVQNTSLSLSAANVVGFGNSVDFGNRTWAVAGASESNSGAGYAVVLCLVPGTGNYDQTQLLVEPSGGVSAIGFGSAVKMSSDERWMYIGAPGAETVYAYSRVDVPIEYVEYVGDGTTSTYNYSDSISIDPNEPLQLVVTINNALLTYNTDYTITSSDVQFVGPVPRGSEIVIRRRAAVQLDSDTYYNVVQNSTTGSGTGAKFTVTNTRGSYSVSATAPGQGYAVSDQITISYTQVCPAGSAANNLTLTVTEVTNGGVTGFTSSGSGVSNTSVFSLTPYLYTVNGYDSFTVLVDGELQRPRIDYIYSAGTLTFLTIPSAGAIIIVQSAVTGAYWQYVDSLTVDGIEGAAFGTSITTDSISRQILIGAPTDAAVDANGYTINNAGAVYGFDRSAFRYIITDATQTTYAIPGTFSDPIGVVLNNQYLTNTAQYLDGQFSVSGSNIVLASSVELNVGDTLEIETNQFQQIQKFAANTVIDLAEFGQSLDICSNNCSVYVGSPLDSYAAGVSQAGLVQRQVNQSRVYGITTSTIADPTLTAGDTIRVNLQSVTVPDSPNNTVEGLAAAINASGIPNVAAVVSNGYLTINVINLLAAIEFDKLTVLPGTGTAFDDLGFITYAYTQTITSPNPTIYAQFGTSVNINTGAVNLVVGSPNGDVYEPTVFDGGNTYFDDRSTTIFGYIYNSGVVYTYDYLPSATSSVATPGNFVFGQQVYVTSLETGDRFGTAVNYRNGRLVVGAPSGNLLGGSELYGSIAVLDNPADSAVWNVIYAQQPAVDVNLLNGVYSYNKLLNSTQTYFDYIDPLQGKILGVARRNIDYIGAVDPANYNTGGIHNIGTSWGAGHVGEIWWDTNSVRFVDANQDNLVYASRRWGQVFPGSTIDIYQWISSSVAPASYTGDGTPLSASSYTVQSTINDQGIITTTYYFWVKDITTTATQYGKTLSATAIASYILSPSSSGLPYIAALSANAVAIYNSVNLLSANDTILHVEYDRQVAGGDNDIHVEYEFIADGKAKSFLNPNLYRKLLDSFCGQNTQGNNVPDPLLSPGMQYGIEFRPRQSMFLDRFKALENYLNYANAILAQYPISETRNFNLLNASEPTPAQTTVIDGTTVTNWNYEVADLTVLNYQDLAIVPYGYKYLVLSDSTQQGRWTIYEVTEGTQLGEKVLSLFQVQSYDTPLYWSYINWYLPGYNSSIQPVAAVTNTAGLQQLSLFTAPVGSSVKVTANGQGNWEIYRRIAITGVFINDWERVGLENGTIAFDSVLWNYVSGGFGFDAQVFDAQYFDQAPTVETRYVLRAINEELFTDDLLIYRNQGLMLMFHFIYSEFTSPNWLVKTSYIDVNHVVRGLVPYQLYQADNQTFVLDYLTEVKPYHVQTLAFNLIYDGLDLYPGALTDFDLPAYWDQTLEIPQFVSPILLPYTHGNSAVQTTTSDTESNAQIWLESPYSYWYQNYLENSNLIRSIKTTIKYDRYEYYSTIVEWQADVTYNTGDRVRWNNRVWESDITQSTATFNVPDWTVVPASELSGVDRTMGYYVPTVNMPGLSLPLLIDGVDYPGVQVTAPTFSQNTGFDVGNYSINPYDNISYDAEGRPTYDPNILDARYSSAYLDLYLGTRPTDINVDGGGYIDTFSSYAPEELIPGSEFDTLDFRVYTTPGADWTGRGHGFPASSRRYVFDPENPVLSFAGILQNPMVVILFNATLGVALEPESYDWANYELTVSPYTAAAGDTLVIYVTGTGGGNQLLNATYLGSDLPDGNEIVIPFPTTGVSTDIDSIYEFLIYNGEIQLEEGVDYTYAAFGDYKTKITFTDSYNDTDRINLTALGYGYNGTTYSWSLPVFETITVTDSAQLTYTLTNSLQGTNPVNLVVTVDGARARPYEGAKYIGDAVATTYDLPQRGGYSQAIVADADVSVYVNDVLLDQPADYVVDAYSVGVPRTITFDTAPADGDKILIAVSTAAQYTVVGDQLTFLPSAGLSPVQGQIIEIITWNDTREQDLLTQVFVGPTTTGTVATEPYDSTNYSPATVNDTTGSYDYTIGVLVEQNVFDTGIIITDPERILVTLNGKWLFNGIDYNIDGSNVIILGPIISPTAVLTVTSMTQTVVPGSMAFRIFQDMRGVQATYRMTPDTTTVTSAPVDITDDVIWIANINALTEPNLDNNVWGVITIDAERIMYRNLDATLGTISGLLRGTAGTAIAPHDDGAIVYNIGRGNLLPAEYQDYIVSNVTYPLVSGVNLGDGTTTEFTAADITLENPDAIPWSSDYYYDFGTDVVTDGLYYRAIDNVPQGIAITNTAYWQPLSLAVEVYLGGILQTTSYTITSETPVTISFATAPASGVEVTILIRYGVTWYAQGVGTASDGQPLQVTETQAARFLRGL